MKYFKPEEFYCKCGKCEKAEIHDSLKLKLDLLRELIAKPMKITSGIRCQDHNKAVGGAAKSKHLDKIAVDVNILGWTSDEVYRLVQLAYQLEFGGIGIAKTFVHLDTRTENRAIWLY